jgi:hypothetical protein
MRPLLMAPDHADGWLLNWNIDLRGCETVPAA